MDDGDLTRRLQQDLDALRAELQQQREELLRQGYQVESWRPLIEQRLEAMAEDVRMIQEQSEQRYVTHARYTPVERVVYGMVGLVLVTAFTAVMSLVLR